MPGCRNQRRRRNLRRRISYSDEGEVTVIPENNKKKTGLRWKAFDPVTLKFVESRGMVVNKGKTKIICISDAQSYKAKAYLVDSDGQRLDSGGLMKVLGFHLDSRPSVHAHVEALKIRMRDTSWVLRHLKLAGFTQDELTTVYRTVIRPVPDYCAVIYHPMLTDDQDQ